MKSNKVLILNFLNWIIESLGARSVRGTRWDGSSNENGCSPVGVRLRQDKASLGVAAVFLELGVQEVQESAREWATRTTV